MFDPKNSQIKATNYFSGELFAVVPRIGISPSVLEPLV